MRLQLLAFMVAASASFGFAGTLSTFDQIYNGPGFITTDQNSHCYSARQFKSKRVLKKYQKIGVNTVTPSQMISEEEIFDTGFVENTKQRVLGIESLYLQKYCAEKSDQDCVGVVPEKIFKKWNKSKRVVPFQFLKAELESLSEMAITQKFGFDSLTDSGHIYLDKIFQVLDLAESLELDSYNQKLNDAGAPVGEWIHSTVKKYQTTRKRAEPCNLLVPTNLKRNFPKQVFFSAEQVSQLEKEGTDTSLLDPPSSGFWRKPKSPIADYDTTSYGGEAFTNLVASFKAQGTTKKSATKKASQILDKNQVVDIVYEGGRTGGKTLKFNAKILNQKWKVKFATDKMSSSRTLSLIDGIIKHLIGAEAHTEPVVNNLAAALGFSADPTYFQKKVRVYVKDKHYKKGDEKVKKEFKQAIKEISANFPKSYNVASAFIGPLRDSSGKLYYEIKEVSLEKKSDSAEDINISFFVREGYGKFLKREFRAFTLFLFWISDQDGKDRNQKLKLVKSSSIPGSYKVVYSPSDMGGSLGGGMPNRFPKKIVKKNKFKDGQLSKIKWKYSTLFTLRMIDHMSFSDARWMARMIGQLSIDQIENAFIYAGHPLLVARFYTKKLLKRRDQILEALGLFDPSESFTQLAPVYKAQLSDVDFFDHISVTGKIKYRDGIIYDEENNSFPRYWGNSMNPLYIFFPPKYKKK
ncbi:MAG: hypothetical protein HOE90_06015 [Bacteriovoracaceae bacterium]|nr:hypothetical protein [Bacteriovoracaceae bacterium]